MAMQRTRLFFLPDSPVTAVCRDGAKIQSRKLNSGSPKWSSTHAVVTVFSSSCPHHDSPAPAVAIAVRLWRMMLAAGWVVEEHWRRRVIRGCTLRGALLDRRRLRRWFTNASAGGPAETRRLPTDVVTATRSHLPGPMSPEHAATEMFAVQSRE